jgi:hypothetical protein
MRAFHPDMENAIDLFATESGAAMAMIHHHTFVHL